MADRTGTATPRGLVVLLLTAATWVGCDSGSGSTANLSGAVREAAGLAPIPNVTVTVGSAGAVTDDEGRYTLRGLPVGVSTIRVSAPAFEPYAQQLTVRAGDNMHDIGLVTRANYTFDGPTVRVGVHLTAGVPTYRAVIFFVPPATVNALGFANGDRVISRNPPTPQSEALLDAHVSGLRQRALQLAQEHGLALMGVDRPVEGQPLSEILSALEQIAEQSGHTELEQVPLLLVGWSEGGCFAHQFTRLFPDRVVGFVTQKCGFHALTTPQAVARVPGYLFIGGTDSPEYEANITQLFQMNRANGALWALAVEPGAGHTPVVDFDLFEHWMDAVLAARLPTVVPPGSPVTLNDLDEASGWLGSRQTFVIAPYAQYGGNPLQASWLPTMQTAQDWQSFVTP